MNEDGQLIRIFQTLNGCNLTVEDMDLEVSVRNVLKRSGIHTVAQLLLMSHLELVQVFPNRKLRGYEDVIHCLVCLSEEAEKMGTFASGQKLVGFTSVQDIKDTLGGVKMSDKKFDRFNIFRVAGIWKSEEIHTSVIAELLNPQSKFHNKGADFLDKFLQMEKINIQLTPKELAEAKVETEVPTGEGRRIDMVISTKSLYLPFEVKIWAGDQDAQLRDYYTFAEKQAKKCGQKVSKIYYLNPDGHEPSAQSRGGLTKEVRLLSFKDDVLPWLEKCINEPGVLSDVKEIMIQMRDNIQDIQGRPGIQGQGFSRWKGEDVLDAIYRKLPQNLPWTECTADYMTFTLNKMKFEELDYIYYPIAHKAQYSYENPKRFA